MTVVIPAEAGTHVWLSNMGPRFRGDDGLPATALAPGAAPAFCCLLSAFFFHAPAGIDRPTRYGSCNLICVHRRRRAECCRCGAYLSETTAAASSSRGSAASRQA